MSAVNIDPTYPLVELHRHLEGSMRAETILEMGHQYGISLPGADLETLRPYIQAVVPQPGLMAFIGKLDQSIQVLVTADACRRVAYECVVDASEEGIDYLELRFSPGYMARPHNLDPVEVTAAVIDGARAGERDTGMRVSLIGILSRTYGLAACWEEFKALKAHRDEIIALDLAGDEGRWPPELFVAQFREARALGWHVTVHAGEAAGPESVWVALRELGATRIGHALRAIEDLELMEYLAEHSIGIEVGLTSNVQTGAVADYAHHPIRSYLAQGMMVTLNTDDPAVSRITLPYEYNVAAPASGLTRSEIYQVQRNALAVSFLTDQARKALIERKRARRNSNQAGSAPG